MVDHPQNYWNQSEMFFMLCFEKFCDLSSSMTIIFSMTVLFLQGGNLLDQVLDQFLNRGPGQSDNEILGDITMGTGKNTVLPRACQTFTYLGPKTNEKLTGTSRLHQIVLGKYYEGL